MQHDSGSIEATAPDPESENRFGEEPEEESGGGYGNHAPPDPGEGPSEPDKDAR